MIAEDLLNPNLTALKTTDTPEKALRWVEELHLRQLPVTDENGKYLGLITEDILITTYDSDEETLENLPLMYQDTFVSGHQHFYEILKIAYSGQLQLVAVLDNEGIFMGAVTVAEALQAFAKSYSIQAEGSILILSTSMLNYSLTEISRLVETNNAKVLSAFLESSPHDPYQLFVTLKINQPDLSRIIATFERFDYEIVGKHQHTEVLDTYDQSRLDLLLRYIEL
jgi:acetoin utilization protein AcuB